MPRLYGIFETTMAAARSGSRGGGCQEGLAGMSDVTPEVIAQWMVDHLEQQGSLYQTNAVDGIAKTFGDEFTYLNDNGNPAIDKRILRAFRKITGDTVVWERWDFCWRKREAGDAPSRKQE